MAVEADGNLLQGKDSSYGRVYIQDSGRENSFPDKQNGKLVNKVHDRGAKKGVKDVQRRKSPVRGGNPQQTLKWHLAARVFTKWVFLFIIVAGFGKNLWYWTMEPSAKNTVGLGDVVSEGQIAEIEEFLKKTMKML